MIRILLALAFILVLGGCRDAENHAAHQDEASAEIAVETGDWDVFGTAFETSSAVPVETVAASPESYTDGPVRIVGTTTEVCQGMGCWMTLQVPDGRNVRVVMPRDEHGNYVFTLDRTISGRKAVVEGTLAHSTLAEFEAPMHGDGEGHGGEGHHAEVDAQGHHAENDVAGHHAEVDTEDDMNTPELQLTASGVLVDRSL